MTPYLPIDIIAKAPIAKDGSGHVFAEMVEENHLMKLVAHPDYICQVLEEVV